MANAPAPIASRAVGKSLSAQPYSPAPAATQQLGFGLILVYVFLLFSRVQDFLPSVHIPLILLMLCGLAALASGSLLSVINSKLGLCLLAFTVCALFSVPLSVWPGGATRFIVNQWLPVLILFFVFVALVRTTRHVYVTIAAITIGICFLSVLSFVQDRKDGGRLVMEMARFGDPNELAQVMLFGMCLLLLIRQTSWIRRVLICGAGALLFVTFLRTGSRGGLVGLLVALAALIWFGKSKVKIITAVAGMVLLLGGIALAPSSLRSRYLSVFGMSSDSDNSVADSAAESSADAREHLFLQSVLLTIKNPLVGVGTGMFSVAENGLAKSEGMRRGMWHDTHNIFTQVSSENGIPALIIFLAMFTISLYRLSVIHRIHSHSNEPGAADIARIAFGLRITMLAYLGSAAFLSSAYDDSTVLLLALTLALDRAAQSEFPAGAARSAIGSPVPVRTAVPVLAGAAAASAVPFSPPVAVLARSSGKEMQPVSSSVYRMRGARRARPNRPSSSN